MRLTFSAAITAGVVLASIGVLAPPAHAASGVFVSGREVNVTAAPGVANKFWIHRNAGVITVVDGGGDLTPGAGCVAEAANRVRCSYQGTTAPEDGLRYAIVDAGDLNDVVDLRTSLARSTVSMGPGADQVLGSAGQDTIFGGDGNDNLNGFGSIDFLRGGDGIDSLNGGDGSDRFDGGPGPDDLIGGAGEGDQAQYRSRTAGVNVSLDGVPDDGEPGERDNARADLESVYGGSGDDRLVGNGARNDLQGLLGRDTILGGPGADWLRGWQGDDTLHGGDGDDFLEGYQGRDTYSGGAGIDEVTYDDEFDPASTVGITLDADGVEDDGWPWERENVPTDVENLTGSEDDDLIVGTDAANVLRGDHGNDILVGLGGDDLLDCYEGTNDVAHGGADTDQAFDCETITGIP